MFPPKPPYVPLHDSLVPIGWVEDLESFLIPAQHRASVPPWPPIPSPASRLEYPPSDHFLGYTEQLDPSLAFDTLRDNGTLRNSALLPDLFTNPAYQSISDLPPVVAALVRSNYTHSISVRLENVKKYKSDGSLASTSWVGIQQSEVPGIPLLDDDPWARVLAGRVLYKRMLRALFYYKDRFGEAPLFLGGYISSEGIGNAPVLGSAWQKKYGYWQDDSVAFYPDVEVPEPTTVTFPPQIVLGHMASVPASQKRASLRCYQENFTPSYGETTKPYTFHQIAGSILMPPAPLGALYPASLLGWPQDRWNRASFQAARWHSAPKPRPGGLPLPSFHTRATVNLVNPHVRRWWVEKIVGYIEDWQTLASEAVTEYLHGSPSSSLPSDSFYASKLPPGVSSKHSPGWKLGSLFLDNIEGPDYSKGSFFSNNKLVRPSAESYLRPPDRGLGQYKNTWYFMAAMLVELREQLHQRWGMNLMLNTYHVRGIAESCDQWSTERQLPQWPVDTSYGDDRLYIQKDIDHLKANPFQARFTKKEDVLAEDLFDAFMFEQPWENSYTFDGEPGIPIEGGDGRKRVDTGETIPKKVGDSSIWILDLPLEKFARGCRWIRELLPKKKAVIFFPRNPPLLPSILTAQEQKIFDTSFQYLRFYEYRFMCALAWMLRIDRSPLYVAISIFDFKKIYGESRDHLSGKQAPYETNAELLPFYAFEDFFLLPHLLPKREEKGEPFSLFRGNIIYTRKRWIKNELRETVIQFYTERNLLLRMENLPLAFPSQGFLWDSWFPFSLQEASRLRRLFSSSDHAVPEQTDPFLLFKFPEKRKKYIGMEIDLYLARRDQYLPDFLEYKNISAGYSRPFAFPVVSLIQYARPIEQNALTGLLFQTEDGRWKPVETYGTEEFDENVITFDPRRLP